MNIPFVQAKSISYSGTRSYSNIYYIIIHYTGISNDSAENEAKFFATGNTRSAGAHFFVGQDGHIVQSVKMSYTAKSVPRKRQAYKGGGTLVGKCTSVNSVSIEMCDNLTKDPSAKQTEAVRQLVSYIQSVCPNAKTIVRHYDATGKLCPARMTDVYASDAKKWIAFRNSITAKNDTTYQEVEDLTKDETTKLIQELVPGIVEKTVNKVLKGADTTVSTWATDDMKDAVALGITDGTRPGGYSTREQMAVVEMRGYRKILEAVKVMIDEAILKVGGDSD